MADEEKRPIVEPLEVITDKQLAAVSKLIGVHNGAAGDENVSHVRSALKELAERRGQTCESCKHATPLPAVAGYHCGWLLREVPQWVDTPRGPFGCRAHEAKK